MRTYANCEHCGASYETTKGKDNLEYWCELPKQNVETKGLCCFCDKNNRMYNKKELIN